jgi:hydroxyacylglutathione hydrolase
MQVIAVPCLVDNYAYLLVCESTLKAAVVDPSEAEPVLQAVRRERVDLVAILNTHHHHDHTGGNDELADETDGLLVYGHASDHGRIPGLTLGVEEGDEVCFGNVRMRVIHNPGHTKGAVSYYGGGAVLTGDTMFVAGCGRLFEGTASMMHASLTKIAGLPEDTRVYPGHEYANKNLRFAATVDPRNAAIAERGEGVPSTIALERATNPFLRCSEASVRAAALAADPGCDGSPEGVFAVIRRLRDRF